MKKITEFLKMIKFPVKRQIICAPEDFHIGDFLFIHLKNHDNIFDFTINLNRYLYKDSIVRYVFTYKSYLLMIFYMFLKTYYVKEKKEFIEYSSSLTYQLGTYWYFDGKKRIFYLSEKEKPVITMDCRLFYLNCFLIAIYSFINLEGILLGG